MNFNKIQTPILPVQNAQPVPSPALATIAPINQTSGTPFIPSGAGTPFLGLAYTRQPSGNGSSDVETRLQRLERGQKVSRAGRVVLAVPQFRTQSIVSQTSANSPFSGNTVSGLSIPSGQVPNQASLNLLNVNIRYPQSVKST